MAAALAVVARAPHSVQPLLHDAAFNAFSSGLRAACLAGTGVAIVGAAATFGLLSGRSPAVDAQVDSPTEVDSTSAVATTVGLGLLTPS